MFFVCATCDMHDFTYPPFHLDAYQTVFVCATCGVLHIHQHSFDFDKYQIVFAILPRRTCAGTCRKHHSTACLSGPSLSPRTRSPCTTCTQPYRMDTLLSFTQSLTCKDSCLAGPVSGRFARRHHEMWPPSNPKRTPKWHLHNH